MSREMQRYQWSNKCPLCGRFTLASYELPNGRRLSRLTLLPTMDRTALARCGKCAQQWPVFGGARPAPVVAAPPQQVDIVETVRSEEPLGDEVRRIDNSGAATAVRRLQVSRRWSRRWEVQVERTQSSNSGFDLSSIGLAGIKSSTEDAVRRSYGADGEEEQTFTEELELTLQPHTAVVLTVHWKRIWQEGVAVVQSPAGLTRVPFRAVTGVTFDQTVSA